MGWCAWSSWRMLADADWIHGYLFWISLGRFGYACACLLVLEVDKVEIGFVVVIVVWLVVVLAASWIVIGCVFGVHLKILYKIITIWVRLLIVPWLCLIFVILWEFWLILDWIIDSTMWSLNYYEDLQVCPIVFLSVVLAIRLWFFALNSISRVFRSPGRTPTANTLRMNALCWECSSFPGRATKAVRYWCCEWVFWRGVGGRWESLGWWEMEHDVIFLLTAGWVWSVAGICVLFWWSESWFDSWGRKGRCFWGWCWFFKFTLIDLDC